MKNSIAILFAVLFVAACGGKVTVNNFYGYGGNATGGMTARDGTGGRAISPVRRDPASETGGSAGDSSAGGSGIGGVGGAPSGLAGVPSEGGEELEFLNLTLQLAEDTPESRIVVSGSEELFTKYVLRNPNAHDVDIISMILQTSGSVADFSSVRLTDCREGGWEKKIDAPCIGEALCHFPEEYGSHTSIYGLFPAGERLRVPASGEVILCLFAHMAEVHPTSVPDPTRDRLPRSGDIPNLRVGNMITNDADVVDILAPYEPPSMVLRKAEPIITWTDAEETLHEGLNMLAQITISSTDQARPVCLQQVWLIAESSDLNMLTLHAAQTRLRIEHRSIDETVTWEWDGVTPPDRVGGHTNERGVFMWEESVPDTAYTARVMFYNDEVATPEFTGLIGPLTVSLWADVQGVSPGSSVTTRLTSDPDLDCLCQPTQAVTSSLTLFNGNGLLIDALDPESPIPWQGARLWWSDMSEGADHHPMDWSDGAASPPIPSSPDYADSCLIVGADVGSVITAP
jgi:hypothetical protein